MLEVFGVKLKKTRSINNIKLVLIALFAGVVFSSETVAADAVAPASAAAQNSAAMPEIFAKVDGVVITQQDYDAAFASAARSKFYHGKPPEAELAALQREVGDKLVTNVLLVKEARHRGLKPDEQAIANRLEQHEQRNRENEQWQKNRDQWLPIITSRLQEESLLNQLESVVRDVPPPTDAQLRKYYTAHPDKFTEPEQLRVSIILIAVDPSSLKEEVDKARELGADLVKQLRAGADFAELARAHPGDAASAERGGDMGYLHGGMLPEAAQTALDNLKVGEISDPVRLLEGIAIFRLTDRNEAKLGDFDVVKTRAGELWLKEEGERVWKSLISQLKKAGSIQVDESRYSPLPEAVEEQEASKIQQ